MSDEYVYVILDGPPGPKSGRFIDIENDKGEGINVGDWIEQPHGMWALRILVSDGSKTDFVTPCPTCGGDGWDRSDPRSERHPEYLDPCPACDGLGLVPSDDAVEAVADAIADLPYDTLELRRWGSESVADPYRIVAKAAISALAERRNE